jgi:hypothetical protein
MGEWNNGVRVKWIDKDSEMYREIAGKKMFNFED